MCIAIPVRVIRFKEEAEAIVEIDGVSLVISTALVPEVKEGDYVLLHAGCALQVIDQQQALKTLSLLEELTQTNE